jgi:GT2 family glycosyltransferase
MLIKDTKTSQQKSRAILREVQRQTRSLAYEVETVRQRLNYFTQKIAEIENLKEFHIWSTVNVMLKLTGEGASGLRTTIARQWFLWRHHPQQFALFWQDKFILLRAIMIAHLPSTDDTDRSNRTQGRRVPQDRLDLQDDAVDAVIPWYGDKHIFTLLPALLQTSDNLLRRVIVIDDAYPNKKEALKVRSTVEQINIELAKKNDVEGMKSSKTTFEYFRQSKNGGFVKSANTGLQLSQRDVILLNSDVLPTKGWLHEILLVTSSDPSIASATPMSNNATIFSIPKMNHANRDNQPEQTAEILRCVAPFDRYPVPTGVGFCLYLRRACLLQVGNFDEQAFGKGYGEENDLCQRFLQAGFKNVAIPRSYVLHLESQSFGHEQRLKQLQHNLPILFHKHPTYAQQVQSFITLNPFLSIQQLVVHFRRHRSELKTESILVIVHRNPFISIGGVERETQKLLEHLFRKYPKRQIVLYYWEERYGQYQVTILQHLRITSSFLFDRSISGLSVIEWLLHTFQVKHAVIEHLHDHDLRYPAF